MDFSKIETGKLEIVPVNYLFSSLVIDVINIIKARIFKAGLHFITYVDSNLPNELFGDVVRIRQVILNLLSNAVKYTERGYISLSVTGEMTEPNTFQLVIEVSDSGKGIKQEDIVKLFDDFIRLDMVNNSSIEGTGLGLTITQNLVKGMGGKIEVSSVYGKGSTFKIFLPQEPRSSQKLAEVKGIDNNKVLIFERRENCNNSIKHTMDDLGLKHKIVIQEDEFLRELESKEYPFVFTSLTLYDNIKEKFLKIMSDTRFLLTTEFGETFTGKNISIISTPLFSIPIANFLNGVSGNKNYGSNYETIINFSAPSARVLIVDDINTNLEVAIGLLRPYNMLVDVCNSGRKAIEMIKENVYDLVLMDHMMPEMDGIQTVALVREMIKKEESNCSLPIIALTANAVSGAKEMFLGHNFNDFLTKPIDTLELNSILEKWIPKDKQIVLNRLENKYDITEVSRSIKIEGINIQKGIALAGGSVKNYLKTLSVFYNDGIEKIKEIKSSLEDENINLYTIYIHAIKSASAGIGCENLAEAAKLLEEAGGNKDLLFIKNKNEEFLENFMKILNNIDSCIKESKRNKKSDFDMALMEEELYTLKNALNNLDSELIRQSVNGLQSFINSPGIGTEIKNILQKVLIGEYDGALESIDILNKK